MAAIGRVESGRSDGAGRVDPWPWSINAEGVDHVFQTKVEAVAAVRALQSEGVRSIDVGCMQVNLMYHPEAFASLDEAFDPGRNADYAARFLTQLHAQTGNWATATAWYHSATPELGAEYRRRVMAALPAEQAQPSNIRMAEIGQPVTSGPFMLGNRPSGARSPAPARGSFRPDAGRVPRPTDQGHILGGPAIDLCAPA